MSEILKYTLPLTTSTGKARVKRRKNNFGEPISVKGNNVFTEEDYIEWQISYFMNLDTLWSSFRKSKSVGEIISFFKETFNFFKTNQLIVDLEEFLKNNLK